MISLPPDCVLWASAAQLDEQQLQHMGPLRALLQSLLPWVNAGQAPDYEADGEQSAHQANGSEQHENAEQRRHEGHEPDNG